MLRAKDVIFSKITGRQLLTTGKLYQCVESYISSTGDIDVLIIDDNGTSKKFPYILFDDISKRRDDILKDLLD